MPTNHLEIGRRSPRKAVGSEDRECAGQSPYTAILSCSDARAATEMIFQQGFNDLFVVRVGGNVLGRECVGSLSYAVDHFPEFLKVVAVLGHVNCGSRNGGGGRLRRSGKIPRRGGKLPAPNDHRSDHRFRSDGRRGPPGTIPGPVVAEPDYRSALLEVGVPINAAWNAFSLREELINHSHCDMKIVFGVYDVGGWA